MPAPKNRPAKPRCQLCGRLLPVRVEPRGRRRHYCSAIHRQAAWRLRARVRAALAAQAQGGEA